MPVGVGFSRHCHDCCTIEELTIAFCLGGERDETLLPSKSPSSRNYALLIDNDFGVDRYFRVRWQERGV
jgi:hypothetical protein